MDTGLATLMAGALLAVPGTLTYLQGRHIKRVGEESHAQLVTLNEGTVGTFAAEDETRRIEAIPHDQRTPTEQRHIEQAQPREDPQGPPR